MVTDSDPAAGLVQDPPARSAPHPRHQQQWRSEPLPPPPPPPTLLSPTFWFLVSYHQHECEQQINYYIIPFDMNKGGNSRMHPLTYLVHDQVPNIWYIPLEHAPNIETRSYFLEKISAFTQISVTGTVHARDRC